MPAPPPAEVTLRGLVLSNGALVAGQVNAPGGPPAGPDGTIVLPDGWVVTPGFVDLQVNGYAGLEVDAPGALADVAAALARDGVVAFCPTLVSRPLRDYPAALERMRQAPATGAGARVAGVHLEGPFLAPTRPGAHPPAALQPPTPEAVAFVRGLGPAIVTLAPERDGALAAIAQLAAAGVVVAAGHTEADGEHLRAAAAAGLTLLTHAFNAMPPIGARGPSGLAAALTHPGVHVAVIADGHHVHPDPLALAAAAAGDRLVVTSDAVAAAGAPPGRYTLAGRAITSDGRVARTARGRLAGGVAPLWQGVANLVAAGVPRGAALAAACEAPRRVLGGNRVDTGATLVVLDSGNRPRAVALGGTWLGDGLTALTRAAAAV